MHLFLKTLSIALLFSFNCLALSPEPHLPNEFQEQRARDLFLEVRCLVCEGQVIESSNTEFSFQMRKLIREKVETGQTNQEIKNDLIKEFGEDILTSTDFSKNNFMLWILPFMFATFLFIRILRKNYKSI